MADAVVSCVIERLADLLIDEAKFLSGVKDQIENAKIKLQCMAAFLKDADAFIENGDERVRLLVVKVRDTSYDLEDVIETYIFKVVLKKKGGLMGVFKRTVFLSREGIDIHEIGSEIERISSNIDTWTSNLKEFGVHESIVKAAETSSSQGRHQRRRAYSFVEDDIVGFDKDIEELVARLTATKNPHNPRVISLCGMGGLGKTTLARKVFQHPQVRIHFECFAWASISQQCNRRHVLEEIFNRLTSTDDARNLSDERLAERLYNLQKEKKCLVLLDDIWTTDTWDLLKEAFPQGDTDSKILLTTRTKNVGHHADQYCYTHQPDFLDHNQSWELFQNKCSYFGNDQTNKIDAEKMEALGREMVGRCSGLPLAIAVLSGLLSGKRTVDEWEEMNRNVVRYISRGKKHDNLEVSWVLGLSYDELPFYLKPCFLYLAGYCEDATIQVKELCLMLMAEGFITPTNDSTKTMEDIAYNYLCELVERSMIQVENWGSTGRMKTFRIPVLMRDFCVSKAQDDNFFHFVDLRNKVEEPQNLGSILEAKRRAAIYHKSDYHDFYSGFDHKNGSLRCLMIDVDYTLDKGYNSILRHMSKYFFRLRILNLSFHTWARFDLPKNIGDLIHLRMLSMDKKAIVSYIPSSIGNLRWLQTLKLQGDIKRVPDVLWKLENLRHLYLEEVYPRLRRLKLPGSLQTLVGISSEWFDCGDFTQMKNLKKLKIIVGKNLGRFYSHPPTVSFDCLQHLQVHHLQAHNHERDIDIVPIILSYPRIYKLNLIVRIRKLPDYNQFPPNLVKLKLQYAYLMDDPMPTLERLSSLKVLCLYRKTFLGNEMVCSKGGFPRLESLEIHFHDALEEWKVEEGVLSSLQFLGIVHCKKLRNVPDGLRYITTLKEMKIQSMPSEFIERIKEGGEDFYKVEHVPSREFHYDD